MPKGVTVDVRNAYDSHAARGAGSKNVTVDTKGTGGWYDITVSAPGTTWVRGFAGHLEDGKPSVSDPQLGG
ncbi:MULTISPECIES: phospholipase domain-containing protein [unclassified Pseudofrankia]|uniref:phospholipase domain-containing protein n=1 Tax=unclassified Pseudofrankia TaxID=2994372 RepID=UPI0008D9114F|nr:MULTISPECIES: phospholipase domain-containing protein [unclassified Pseudofrankia]MDT3440256.1 DUF756 domain-containing protein [Pseudofrankia sp. BMG5.37]OHV73406.1 hypothetical protein BCD48_33510 [Pseudofrankia sp. BMG5.36]